MIGILNYGLGNIGALKNIFIEENIQIKIITYPEEIDNNINKLILPGVGSYDNAIKLLIEKNLFNTIKKFAQIKSNFIMGICVGMQILGFNSEEGSETGLNLIPGSVFKFSDNYIVPNMGWHRLITNKENLLLKKINNEDKFYFLHSYYFKTKDEENILAYSNYYYDFTSIINKDNVYGLQFHPEKSHNSGKKILLNFNNL
ncbi:imidazole glycerol phosphate synthase subunit HisH [Candidatus Pelagibacter sp.]|nr:imidazole glycerol phosphate synthase subunit HisH [Candidatus Pelagibacter sp.]